MTENDEKLAIELAEKLRKKIKREDRMPEPKKIAIEFFLKGLAHERARSQKLVEWAKRAIKGPDKIHLVYPRCNCDECNPMQGLQNAIKEYESGAE